MSPRSLACPAAIAAATALAVATASAFASPPPVPPVSEIPVAPIPKPKKAQAPTPPATPSTTTTVVTTTVTTPSLVAIATEPEAPKPVEAAPKPGATEAMPAPAPRVLITDELPYKATHSRALEQPEHARKSHKHGRHGRPFHPAPGIVVDVTGATGATSAADLQRAARNLGYWPFRHCYEEALERNQQLSGSVSLSLSRLADPSTTEAQVAGSTIKDEMVPLCVAREAQHLTLPWAEAPADTHAEMKVTLSTGDEPVPVPRAVPHAEELRHALRASLPAVQQCFSTGLARHPDDGGRMELRFRTKSSGEILEVSEDEPRFSDVEVTRCVLGVYRTAKLPPMHGDHAGTFVYALHFEAAPGGTK